MNTQPTTPTPNAGMQISQKGIDLIKSFEGCRLKAYADVVGVWTIGYGHTRGVREGQSITKEQAEDLLRFDLASFCACVVSLVTVKLTQNQFDALVSFSFNLGCNALKKSTLLRRLNAGDAGASSEFLKWTIAGGVVLNGLVRRRFAEKSLFDTPMA